MLIHVQNNYQAEDPPKEFFNSHQEWIEMESMKDKLMNREKQEV